MGQFSGLVLVSLRRSGCTTTACELFAESLSPSFGEADPFEPRGLAIPGLRELFLIGLFPAFRSLTSRESREFAKNTLLFSNVSNCSPFKKIFGLAFVAILVISANTIGAAWSRWPWRWAVHQAG